MKVTFKSLASIVLMLALLLGTLPMAVFAEDPVLAVVWGDGETEANGKKYTKIGDAWKAAREKGNIKMLADWKTGTALDVKKGENVTLYMDGKMIDRNKTNKDADISDSGGNGSVFRVGKSASLTIIGGNPDTTHRGYVQNDIWFAGKTVPDGASAIPLYGALITGGGSDSDYGGAITVDGKSTLTVDSVTFAGNIADEYGLSNGNGGAIKLKDEKPTVTLKNSRLCYNRAVAYGGAIISEASEAVINLENTKIDNNKARHGGGIYIDNEKCQIVSDSKSVIEENTAEKDGGGVYIDDESATIYGATIKRNTAKKGGGVYVCDDFVNISNTSITQNAVSEHGGGVYLDVYGDHANIGNDSTFNLITVTNNTATKKGGGFFVETEWEDISFKSTVTIKDNLAGDDNCDNMYFDGGADDSDVIITSSPGRGSCIYLGTSDIDEPWYFSAKGGFNASYFHSDNDQCHIVYDYDKCKLVFKKGKEEQKANIIDISKEDFAAKPTDLKYTVGEESWTVNRGYFSLTESGGDSHNDTVSFYYTDGYFFNDPYKYDTHLATTSMSLVKASGTSKNGGKEDYTNKFTDIRQLLCDMGFDDSKTRVNDEYLKKMTANSIGVIISQKKLMNADGSDSGRILLPVVVRSSGYESEWAGNFNLGTEGEHQGFSIAAATVIEELDAYIKEMELTGLVEKGNVCFWLCGFSRGGATTNLVAKRLIERYDGTNNKIFAYTFAAPQGGVQSAQTLDDAKYFNIHNTVNLSDFVPYLATVEMGFKRYGVDHYVPGSPTDEIYKKELYYMPDGEHIKESDAVYYADNKGYSARRDEDGSLTDEAEATYGKQRELMMKQFVAVAGGNGFTDYFHVGTIDFFTFFNGIFEETGDADVTIDEWLADFLHYVQVWGTDESYDIREYLAGEEIAHGMTICEAVGDLMNMIMYSPEALGIIGSNLSAQTKGDWFVDGLLASPTIIELLIDCFNVFMDEGAHTYELVDLINDIWDVLDSTGMLDGVNNADRERIKKDLDVVLILVLRALNNDYVNAEGDYRDGLINPYNSKADLLGVFDDWFIMTGTFINNKSFLENHSTRTYEAWIRSYDSYFTDYEIKTYGGGTDYAPRYVSLPAEKISAPELASVEEGKVYNNSALVELDLSEELEGGSIYYTLSYPLDGQTQSTGLMLYTDDFELSLAEGKTTNYKLEYYAMSYGVKSETVTVNFTVKPHPVSGSIAGTGNVIAIISMAVVLLVVAGTVVVVKKKKSNSDQTDTEENNYEQ